MKSFYGGTYVAKELLEENNIYHPIRLEYYKLTKDEESRVFYGIEIVKTEYKTENIKVERKELENITQEEKEIIDLLEKFKVGSVTPDFLGEMVEERKNEKVKSY